MPTEHIGKYEIDYEAAALAEGAGWAAYVTIYGKSDNPAHRKEVVARQRVALNDVFGSDSEALAAAQRIAVQMVTES